MNKSSYLQILVGNENIDSRPVYKYALLRGQLGFLLGVICLSYVFIDWYNGIDPFIPYYVLGVGFSFLIILLNRKGHYAASSFVLLMVSNLLVYLFAAVDEPASGVFFFFVTTIAMSIMLYYPHNMKLAIFFLAFGLILAFLAYFGNWSPIEPPIQSDYMVKINFIINFSMGISSTLLILFFFIHRNLDSESILVKNQDELRSIADKLELSKRRFQMAVEGSNAGIYEWNIKTGSIFVSTKWLHLLGYTSRDSPDIDMQFFMSMVHPEDAPRTNESIQKALMTGGIYQNELRMKTRSGEYRWFLDSGKVNIAEGEPNLAVGSITDVSDRKLAENELIAKNEELEKINTELDRFVYSASHDMRAPLSTLLGLLQLARLTDDRSELSKYFEMMTDRIYTMEGFIREVTDYSRNARLDIECVPVDLSSLVDDLIRSFDLLAREAGVKFLKEIELKAPIHTDSIRLKVVLNNLISNAIKYHNKDQKSREVCIGARKISGNYHISVSDNGLGVPEKYRDRIFEMFFRASERSDGSGLGLYIVRETLERMGGDIRFNPREGGGSVFEVILPVTSTDSSN